MSTELQRRPPAAAASHRQRILALMRSRAGTLDPWVSGRDFRAETTDGHAEIPNITPRVSELRRQHQIVTERGPDGCARYRLEWDRGDDPPFDEIVAEAREAVDDAREQLALELPPASPPARLATYGEDL